MKIALSSALGLGAGRLALTLAEAIRSTGEPTLVVAIGDGLSRSLTKAGLPVVAIARAPKKRKKGPPQVAAEPSHLPFGDGSVDAVMVAGAPPESPEALQELARVVREDGLVALATPGSPLTRKNSPPAALAASFVHAAFVDVQQRQVGSTLVTSGRVRRFGHARLIAGA